MTKWDDKKDEDEAEDGLEGVAWTLSLRSLEGSLIRSRDSKNSNLLSSLAVWLDCLGDFRGKLDGFSSKNDFDENFSSNCKFEEFDITELRKQVKIERKRANTAYAELEKERAASATAAEEAMAMILRLWNEKSVIEMEANRKSNLKLKVFKMTHAGIRGGQVTDGRLIHEDGIDEEDEDIESQPNVLVRKNSTSIVT
ncbi:unnamed protein product [Fraxinus pennsylvanica]|uniref:GTD-binding domain-containing protein n=1 Tax=Fraxinus pennsylvanica TaxID=56036 RepID=A0AAD1ZR73_9LAMI|nr:unnamed protein product [Fraxinus pennsylvanica]